LNIPVYTLAISLATLVIAQLWDDLMLLSLIAAA
jgi:hypothetical protein